MFIKPKIRDNDAFGSGHFHASRGERKHNGIDLVCTPGTTVFSSIDGVVTKRGYPYSDDLNFRYIEIEDEHEFFHRVFYVKPLLEVGCIVNIGDAIGITQTLDNRYPTITEHIHYEVIKYEEKGKKFFDPNVFL